jgi:argininosuccinate lyase
LRRESIAARIEDGFLDATTLMEWFIAREVPMRSAHEAVGKLVRECEQRKCRLADLPDAAFNDVLGEPGASAPGVSVRSVLGVSNALAAFRSYGSTAPAEVARQLREWRERLS